MRLKGLVDEALRKNDKEEQEPIEETLGVECRWFVTIGEDRFSFVHDFGSAGGLEIPKATSQNFRGFESEAEAIELMNKAKVYIRSLKKAKHSKKPKQVKAWK